MLIFKKLLFGVFFYLSLYLYLYFGNNLVQKGVLQFSLNLNSYLPYLFPILFAYLSGLFFSIFLTLSQDFKLSIPVIFLSGIFVFLSSSFPQNLMLTAIYLLFSLILFFFLERSLKSYLNFNPTLLLASTVKNFSNLLILILSINFFLNLTLDSKTKPFQVPDELIETALSFSPRSDSPNTTQDQIKQLKGNPALLNQFGIDPKAVDQLVVPGSSKFENNESIQSSKLLKETLKSQINKLLEPYQKFIPLILSLILFFTLLSLNSIISLFLPGSLTLIFFILEKVKFTKFIVETRQVKKLIV